MKYKEFLDNLQEDERMARADYKVGPSGRKSHKEIVFKDGDADDTKEVKEDVELEEAKDTVVKDASGKVVSFKHEGDWKKTNTKKNPEGKVHNLAGQALQKAKQLNKEEVELEENAPVAPALVKHRISVTVSDPDHTMVSKRKEKIQKTVIVTHSDNKEGARAVGEKYYKKKGYRVHDSHHAGMVNEEVISEGAYEKAEENKKSADAAKKQGDMFAHHLHMADHHDNMAQWHSSKGRHSEADRHAEKSEQHHEKAMTMKEEVEQIDEKSEQARKNKTMKNMMDASRGARWKVQNKVSGDDVRDWDGKHKTAQAQNKAIGRALRNEEEDMSKLTYTEFLAKLQEQLLEYTPGPGGVTRVQGRSYGAQYHDPEGDDDADDKPAKKAEPAVKRGRGRPAGSKSGANQKVTSGKSYGGIATHSLHLPNSNR